MIGTTSVLDVPAKLDSGRWRQNGALEIQMKEEANMLNQLDTPASDYRGMFENQGVKPTVTHQPDSLLVLAQEVDQHLQAVRQILRQPLESQFSPDALTGPQRNVMHALMQCDGLSLKDLSRKVGLAHSTVSGIVDRLEKRGLVQRQVTEADRRMTRIVVTEHVLALIRTNFPGITISPLVAALTRATPEEQVSILAGLRNLRTLLSS